MTSHPFERPPFPEWVDRTYREGEHTVTYSGNHGRTAVTVDDGSLQRDPVGQCMMCEAYVGMKKRHCGDRCRQRASRHRRRIGFTVPLQQGACALCGGRLAHRYHDFCSETCRKHWYEGAPTRLEPR